MSILASVLVVLVAVLHLGFLVLEMFLWRKPMGRRIFRKSIDEAEFSAVLAANQGLYNGFLAAGLLVSFLFPDAERAFAFRTFFLGCVIVAGVYGGVTVFKRILLVQALPAALALAAVVAAR